MAKTTTAAAVTRVQMEALCELSDALDRLFSDDDASEPLGPCMLTFSRPGGNAKAVGFFRPAGWEDAAGKRNVSEIAINPEAMQLLGFRETVQTLVHEKVHQWQHEHGKESRAGYHNKQWAEKMERLGLMPSSTGEPGGRKTGQRMGDYVIADGPLDRFIRRCPKRLRLPFMGLPSERRSSEARAGYVKYTCNSCDVVARAKAGVNIWCGDCDAQLEGEEE